MLSQIFLLLTFLTPQFKLSSDKNIYLKGKGPPLIFSTGLFGGMPNFLYSNLQNQLSKNFTLVLNKNYKPFVEKDIEEISEELEVEKLALFVHSSTNEKILESQFLNKMVLCDPIILPNLNTLIGNTKQIETSGDILIIKAEKLYRSDRQLPEVQNPIFNKKKIYKELMYKDVGHPDLLNDYWADFAIKTKLWRGITIEKQRKKFNDWKFDKNNNYKKKLQEKRKEYRKFIKEETINFIL